MVPNLYVSLSAMPLNSNGKIDRRALPSPEMAGVKGEKEYVAPRNAVEDILAGMWTELLRVQRVGIYDDFFALGGHSMLAAHLVKRVQEKFHVEIPVRAVFESPTISAFADVLARTLEQQGNVAVQQ
jgi:hypothetical protein